MTKDMFDISDHAWGMHVEAVKEFTDREDPQEAFERKFRVLSENWKKTYYVLCYYGIGGIGKTSFVNKLCRVIRGLKGNELRLLDKIDCNYIRYDFDAKASNSDKLSILLSLRKQLGDVDKNFKFFRFDSAVLLYAKKSGSSIEKDETVQSLLEKNPWLDVAITTVGIVPVVGWVSGVIQTIDKSAKTVKESIGKHMDEAKYRYHLNEIDSMEMPELLGKLHEYFILDMRYNMQRVAEKPLIVFLDTYERYVDSFEEDGIKGTRDHWLRKGHARSVIRSIPGIMWVVTGREKLNWNEDDEWGIEQIERPLGEMTEEEKNTLAEQHLEQHLMGDLSLKDTSFFLEKAGICDEKLRNQLFLMTSGTPLFLDISVDLYAEIVSKGKTPQIEDFGNNYSELIVRYMEHMPLYARGMICFFSCVGKWTQESLAQIISKTKAPVEYWERRYKEFLNHSFVIMNKNGEYYIHDTVKKAAYDLADAEMKKIIRNAKLQIFEENRKENEHVIEYSEKFVCYIDALYDGYASYEEIENKQEVVVNELHKIEQRGDYYTHFYIAKQIVDRNIEILGERHCGTIATIVSLANAYSNVGNKKKALELRGVVYSVRKELLGEEHVYTLQACHALGISYYETGQIEKALEVREYVYKKYKELLGDNHPATLSSLHALSLSYYSVGDYAKALENRKLVYEKRKVLLGENHSDTLWTLHNLAISYSKIGKENDAFSIRKNVYEKRKILLGGNHPDTLWSYYALADSYSKLGEKEKALEIRKEIYRDRKQILGEEHPDSLTSLYSIAKSYFVLGEQQQAMNLMKNVYEKRREVLGINHPETVKANKFLMENPY